MYGTDDDVDSETEYSTVNVHEKEILIDYSLLTTSYVTGSRVIIGVRPAGLGLGNAKEE
jgi:hypothetical protein